MGVGKWQPQSDRCVLGHRSPHCGWVFGRSVLVIEVPCLGKERPVQMGNAVDSLVRQHRCASAETHIRLLHPRI